MKQEDIVTFYGQVRIATIKPEADAGGLSHFQMVTKYINNTRKIVRAKLRSNVELTFPAVPVRTQHSYDETFIIRRELVVSNTCVEAMRNYFTNLPEANGELDAFRKVYLQVYESLYRFGRTQELRCVVEYSFSEAELNANGGIFYHDELDTLFKFGDEPFAIAHPHSAAGRTAAIEEAAEKIQDEHGFVFWIEIIDNLGRYGERFVSICNQIYKIVPKRDKNRPDGLYIVSSKPSNGRINSPEIQVRMYPLDNIEKELGVYATFELAQTHGDIAGARKRELQEREHEFARERQEWQQEKLRLEREADERKRQLADAEAQRIMVETQLKELRAHQEHLSEMQRIHMKDKYEERSAERKDASEFIKFLPAILTGIGTILMFWKSFTKGIC